MELSSGKSIGNLPDKQPKNSSGSEVSPRKKGTFLMVVQTIFPNVLSMWLSIRHLFEHVGEAN